MLDELARWLLSSSISASLHTITPGWGVMCGRIYAPACSALPLSLAVVLATDKFARSEFEQQSEAMLALKGWRAGCPK